MSVATAAVGWARKRQAVLLLWWCVDGVCACPLAERCSSPGKHPLTDPELGLLNGKDNASSDPETVALWTTKYPLANVGVVVPPGHAVLDVDVRSGGEASLAEWDDEGKKLPPTLTIITGGGGQHLWFSLPEGLGEDDLRKDLAPGVELRIGGKHYVVVPPSRHVSGGVYRIAERSPVAPMPPWLAKLARKPARPKLPPVEPRTWTDSGDGSPYGLAALAAEVQAVVSAPEGGRNNQINTSSFKLGALEAGGELRPGVAEEALWGAARASGLADEELEKTSSTIERGLIDGAGEPRRAPETVKPEKPARRRPATARKEQPTMPPDEVQSTQPEPPATREAVLISASKIQRERVEWLVLGRVPLGAVTVLFGQGGLGKSLYTTLLGAQLTRGELGEPGYAIFATAEDSLSATLRPRLEAVEADLDRVGFVVMRQQGIDDGIVLPDDVGELERLVNETGARLVVIDPLVAHLAHDVDSWRDQSVRTALAPLYRLAERCRCSIIVVLHVNKGNLRDPIERIGGSVGFGNAARSVLLLARDPDDPGGEQGAQRVLAHVKCNLAPLAGSIVLEVKPITLLAKDDNPEVESARIVETGVSGYSSRELLAAVGLDPGQRGAADQAREFLNGAFPDGPRLVQEVKKEARAAGISERTLERAVGELSITAKRDEFGGPYMWHPTDAMLANAKKHAQGEKVGEQGETSMDKGIPANQDAMLANLALYKELGEHGEQGEAAPPVGRSNGRPPEAGEEGYRDVLRLERDSGEITDEQYREKILVHLAAVRVSASITPDEPPHDDGWTNEESPEFEDYDP